MNGTPRFGVPRFPSACGGTPARESIGLVQLHELVRFEIQLPWGRWLPLQGEVVYCQPNFGFAIQLTELSEMQRRQFNALFAYATALAGKST